MILFSMVGVDKYDETCRPRVSNVGDQFTTTGNSISMRNKDCLSPETKNGLILFQMQILKQRGRYQVNRMQSLVVFIYLIGYRAVVTIQLNYCISQS